MKYEYPLEIYCNDNIRAFVFGTNRLRFNFKENKPKELFAQEIIDCIN